MHAVQQCPLGSHLEEVHTPLPWREWDRILASHPDQDFRSYIRDALRVGFNYHCSCQKSPRNMASTTEQPQVIRAARAE